MLNVWYIATYTARYHYIQNVKNILAYAIFQALMHPNVFNYGWHHDFFFFFFFIMGNHTIADLKDGGKCIISLSPRANLVNIHYISPPEVL